MKSLLVSLILVTPAFAVHFDDVGFRREFSGWKKNKTANYEFTDTTYRTYIPTITATPSGGIFLTTQVDLVAFGTNGAVSHIDLRFNSRGDLLSAQIRSTVDTKIIDTGLVRRPEAPAPVEGQKAKPFDATEELLVTLFSTFDMEMKKISEGKENEKRDLFSRLSSDKDAKTSNLPAGLRHHINLLLKHTH